MRLRLLVRIRNASSLPNRLPVCICLTMTQCVFAQCGLAMLPKPLPHPPPDPHTQHNSHQAVNDKQIPPPKQHPASSPPLNLTPPIHGGLALSVKSAEAGGLRRLISGINHPATLRPGFFGPNGTPRSRPVSSCGRRAWTSTDWAQVSALPHPTP